MYRIRNQWIVCALICFCSTVAWALPGDWTTYTSMSTINDVRIVGPDLWGATTGGVLRYGLTDSSYTQYTNIDGLAGNQVLAIEEDGIGNIWFGTDGQGLSKFVVRTGEFLPPFIEFRKVPIHCLCYYQDKLFVGTESGVSVFLPNKEPEPEIKETYHQLGRLAKDATVLCTTILEDTLWVGTEKGLAWAWLGSPNLMDPESWTSSGYPPGVRSIIQVDSVMYVGSKYGVLRRTGYNQWRGCGLGSVLTYDLAYYEGALHAATQDGVYRHREGDTWSKLTSVNTASMYGTKTFGLWMGTADGFRGYKDGRIVTVPRPSSPEWDMFTDIAVDEGTGHIWVATSRIGNLNEKGAYAFDGYEWKSIWETLFASTRYATNVVAVTLDRQGRAWLGTWGGSLHILSGTTWIGGLHEANSVLKDSDPSKPQQSYVVANVIVRDAQGNMWISNYNRGVAVIDKYPPTQEAFYSFEDYNPSGAEFRGVAICIDSTGGKWVGTYDAGLFFLDDGGTPFEGGDEHILSFTTSSHKDLTSDKITAMAVDRDGALWVGTDNGLNAIRGTYTRATGTFEVQDWKPYSIEDGLSSNMINAICVDTQNRKWVGTDKGLAKLSAEGEIEDVYTTANSKLVENNVLALRMKRRTGELWIGTMAGLSRLETYLGDASSKARLITVYPNPFVLDGTDVHVTFRGVPDGASVQIFTLAGEVVRVLSQEDIAREGPVWKGLNSAHYYVASGIYFYLVQTPQEQTFSGKIAVINTVP